jgi:hypothetical protein
VSNRTVDLVKKDLDKRADAGVAAYGKPLTDSDDHVVLDWLYEAYNEALDLAVYLRKEMAERKRQMI